MKPTLAVATLALFCAGVWAIAQQQPQPPKPPASEETLIQVDVTRVDVLFTVTDRRGHFVSDLNKNDFEVVENRRPQNILEFNSESNLPLRLGVLIDTSNSIRDRFRFEQQAASEFLRSIIKTNHDKALIMSFDTLPSIASDLTDDPDALDKSIQGLRPGGGTSLYDAIFLACRDKLSLDVPKYKYRRAIVMVTDGDDNQSHYTRDQALEMALTHDVILYAISTNHLSQQTDGDKVLKYLAKETGGRVFFPFKVEDLERSFVDIADELRNQYNIAYRPDPLIADGLFHPMEVRVKNRRDLVVNARTRYKAPKM